MRAAECKARTEVGEHPVLFAEGQVLQEVARALEPTAGLGRAAEVQAVDRELEGEACCSTIVAEVAREPVAALVSVQRRRCVELRGGRYAKTQERVGSLFLGECGLELLAGVLPGALLQRRLRGFERTPDRTFYRAFREYKSTTAAAMLLTSRSRRPGFCGIPVRAVCDDIRPAVVCASATVAATTRTRSRRRTWKSVAAHQHRSLSMHQRYGGAQPSSPTRAIIRDTVSCKSASLRDCRCVARRRACRF